MYSRICAGLNTKGKLVLTDELSESITDNTKDWYYSIYEYTQEHFSQFCETKTVAGITDVTTTKLVWDFDCEEDLSKALEETKELVGRVQSFVGNSHAIQVYFSGMKGFTVLVETNLSLTPPQLKELCQRQLGKDLSTLDPSLYNASRILRCPYTRHPESKLYKIPLQLTELNTLSIDDIKKKAKSLDNIKEISYSRAMLNSSVIPKEAEYKEKTVIGTSYTDYTLKPRWLTNCRWALQNANFTKGTRNSALLCLAATYKNQGFDSEITYRMLKGVAELEAQKTGADRFPDSEIYNNIVLQVYGNNWNNGQFSCRDKSSWLYDYCQSLGSNSCTHDETDENNKPKKILDQTSLFKDYVVNIDKNTIKTGISEIDDCMPITTGTNVGLIGAPGSGKTSLCLKILNNTSKAGIKTVFASLDMSPNRMYEKMLYYVTQKSREELYKLFQNGQEEEILKQVQQEFGNVYFYDRSSPSVDDIHNYILTCQEDCGERIKFVMLDYFERVSSDFSDDTQASKKVAGQLQDIVRNLDIALLTIVQPNKNGLSGGAHSPIRDYTRIKGSSFLYQSFRGILSIWRPFFNSSTSRMDKYLNLAVLKNDLGELKEFVFKWNGKKGDITRMTDEEWLEYKEFEAQIHALEEEQNEKKGWR